MRRGKEEGEMGNGGKGERRGDAMGRVVVGRRASRGDGRGGKGGGRREKGGDGGQEGERCGEKGGEMRGEESRRGE